MKSFPKPKCTNTPNSQQRVDTLKGYRAAFEQADKDFAINAANALLSGQDCTQDLELAVKYAQKSQALEGDSVFTLTEQVKTLMEELKEVQTACAQVCLISEISLQGLYDSLSRFETRGYGIVFNALGVVYQASGHIKEAFEATLSGSDLGDHDASCRLGDYFKDGYYVEKNLEFAINAYWYADINGSEIAAQKRRECEQEKAELIRPRSAISPMLARQFRSRLFADSPSPACAKRRPLFGAASAKKAKAVSPLT